MKTDRLIRVADPNPLIAQARAIVRGESRYLPTAAHLEAVLERLDHFKQALDERDVLIAELLDARMDAHKHAAVEAICHIGGGGGGNDQAPPRHGGYGPDDAETALTSGMGDVK